MTDFKPIRLACSRGPDLHFNGRLLGEFTTQNKALSKDRWTELRLWETPAGNWVAEGVGCSTRNGEGELRDATAVYRDHAHMDPEAPDEMWTAAMDAWSWTSAAKAFARQLGWNVTVTVD